MASGDTLLILSAQHAIAPATANAALNNRNSIPVWEFDASTDESVLFNCLMPRNYAGGGVTVYIHWAGKTATSGNVVWNSAFERIGEGSQDTDSDGFATANAATATASGTSGNVDIQAIAHTNGAEMDSVAVGELFRLKITRDADNGSDTMTGDAQLFAVEIKET